MVPPTEVEPNPRPSKRVKDPGLMKQLHLELVGEPCEVCGIRVGTILHHVKYRSRGGHDARFDEQGRKQLLWVCAICDSDHGELPSISRYA